MSFLYPIFIYLMLPLIVILFYFILTGAKENYAMFEKDVLDRLRSESKSLSRTARNTLYLCAFILMIIALAQPVFKEGEVIVQAKSADILIGIDISDSMKAEDRYPNRLDFAKNKAIELITKAPHNRIGVLAFAKHDYIVSPLSFDHSSVAFLLSKVSTGSITEKGTRIDSMLHSAISMLEHAPQKNLLLFTDGGDSESFEDEIALAKENGLRVFVIGIGSEKGSPVRERDGSFIKHKGDILISRLNPEIKTLATGTGGVYIESVLGEDDIDVMLKEIESIAAKTTLKEETIPQYTQLFYYPLALATFFLFLAFSSFPTRAVKTLFLVGFVFIGLDEAKAGLLDFQELQEAKKAYAKQAYDKSTSIYTEFSQRSPEAAYNLGNSLYKSKEYEKALKAYQQVNSTDTELQAKALHNRANTYVKLEEYKKALDDYEKALKLREDQETRENYELVKKLLEQKEEEKKEKENKEASGKQDQRQKDDSSNQQDSQQSEPQNTQQKEASQNKQKQKSDAEKKSPEKPEVDKKSEDTSKTSQQEKEKKKAKDETQKSQQAKDGNKRQTEQQAAESDVRVSAKKMSDLEAKKWLKMIQKSQKGHLYKIQEAEHEEDENEKPW